MLWRIRIRTELVEPELAPKALLFFFYFLETLHKNRGQQNTIALSRQLFTERKF